MEELKAAGRSAMTPSQALMMLDARELKLLAKSFAHGHIVEGKRTRTCLLPLTVLLTSLEGQQGGSLAVELRL